MDGPVWTQVGDGVVVTFQRDASSWQEFCAKGYGVADLQLSGELPRRRLTMAEAFYAAAIARVLPINGSVSELWQRFCSQSDRFPREFAVYQHFRRLGWILKSGLNYGVHYVLYRGSAAEFHSDYLVYSHPETGPVSWHTIQSLTRIAADVKKTLLVCTVETTISPSTAGSTELDDQAAGQLTFGVYHFFGVDCTVEAVAIRFSDVSTSDDQSFSFEPQPVLLKQVKKVKKKSKSKRPKFQVDIDDVDKPNISR